MLNQRWLQPLLGLLIIGILTRSVVLLVPATLALLTIGAAWLWNHWSLIGVRYERRFSERRVFPGETVELTLRLTNAKLLPLAGLQLEDKFPVQLPVQGYTLTPTPHPHILAYNRVVSLRWYERVNWHYQLTATRRGYYAFGPVQLKTGDGFGLFNTHYVSDDVDRLIVYPRLMTLEQIGLPAKQPFGDTRSPQRIFEDPSRTMGVRDYQPGDAFKRIHWPATARRQQLQVRLYEPTATLNLILCLNVITLAEPWQGIDPEALETLIEGAAALADYALMARYAVGLIANTCPPESDQPVKVPPARTPDQRVLLLEAMAKLTGIATLNLEQLLESEVPQLPWGATLVILTATLSPALQSTLLRLRDAGRKVTVVTLPGVIRAEAIPGILVQEIRPAKMGG